MSHKNFILTWIQIYNTTKSSIKLNLDCFLKSSLFILLWHEKPKVITTIHHHRREKLVTLLHNPVVKKPNHLIVSVRHPAEQPKPVGSRRNNVVKVFHFPTGHQIFTLTLPMAITAQLLHLQRRSADNHPPGGDDVTFVPSHTKVQPQHLSPSLVIVDDAMPSSSNDPKRERSAKVATLQHNTCIRAEDFPTVITAHSFFIIMLYRCSPRREERTRTDAISSPDLAASGYCANLSIYIFFIFPPPSVVLCPRIMPEERHDSYHFFSTRHFTHGTRLKSFPLYVENLLKNLWTFWSTR